MAISPSDRWISGDGVNLHPFWVYGRPRIVIDGTALGNVSAFLYHIPLDISHKSEIEAFGGSKTLVTRVLRFQVTHPVRPIQAVVIF